MIFWTTLRFESTISVIVLTLSGKSLIAEVVTTSVLLFLRIRYQLSFGWYCVSSPRWSSKEASDTW